MTNVTEHLIQLVAKHAELDATTLTPATVIRETGIDSLGVAELIFDIEEHYDISIVDHSDIQNRFDLGTIADLARELEKTIAASA